MRVLITGSSGQIGTNLGLRLLEAGHEVLGIDRRPNAWTERLPWIEHDLLQPQGLDQAIGARGFVPDVLVHLAANAKVHELVVHPERALDNVTTTFNALELARARRLPVVFGSSREAYGDQSEGLTSEDRAVVAKSPYSASKIAGEALVRSYAECYGLSTVTYRFSNVYGRFDNDLERMERVMPLFVREIAAGRPITVFGAEKVLDFTYVDDCVSAVFAGIERVFRGELSGETINVAYGEGNSLLDLVRFIAETLDVEPDVHVEPTRAGEITRYVADISKAQRLLDYAPQVPLREGVRRSIEWSGVRPGPGARPRKNR
ncbi:MAG: NAD-dependent epimerase/dehydratase family protein [Planctomycetota bacterium]